MKTDLREHKWQTPDDARRGRGGYLALLAGWFVIDFTIWSYWKPFWDIVNHLGIWTVGIGIGLLEVISAGGWIRGWQVRDRQRDPYA